MRLKRNAQNDERNAYWLAAHAGERRSLICATGIARR
jgi:hypothetical protein